MHATLLLVLLYIPTKYSQTVWELWPAQDFGFRGDNYKTKTVRVISLALDTPPGPPLQSYQILSKYVEGYQSHGAHNDEYNFCFRGDNELSENCLSCTRHAYWSSSSFLPNILKLSQTVWELWPAQDFGVRGDDYITKTVRVVSLARDTPTGPPLHSYQIYSNYLRQYGSYGLRKISASGEMTILRRQ